MKHNYLKSLFLMLMMCVGMSAWGENYATWTFASGTAGTNYPSNNTAFTATSGSCGESSYTMNGSGSQWNSTKGYCFTAITDMTVTLKLTGNLAAGSSIVFAADMYYNKDSNAPMTGFNLTVSENKGSYVTTGLSLTSLSLSTSSSNKSVTYTTQAALKSGDEITLKYTQTGKVGAGQGYVGNITVDGPALTSGGNETPDPEKELIAIEATGTPAEFWKGDAFNHNGMTVTALWDDGNETDVTSSCTFTGYDMSTPGEQTVTVTYQGETCKYGIEVKTIANTQADAYTVAQAKALIDAGKDLATEVYVKGTVSQIDSYNSTYGSITYWISEDGTTTNQFEVYGGLAMGSDAKFSAKEDLTVGDDVIVYGIIKKYSSTYEFDKNNYLVKWDKIATLNIADITVADGEDITPVITTNVTGEYLIEYTSNNEDVILADGDELVTMGSGNATITATLVADGYKTAETTFNVTVTTSATITSVTISGELTNNTYTIGDTFDHSGLVATANYSDGTNANVTETATWEIDPETLTTAGTVTVTVSASFGGQEDIQEYEVTVNKKEASISFASTAIEVEVGKTQTLAPTTTPIDAEISYTITEGSEYISIENDVVTGVAEGTATIRADYTGSNEYTPASTTFTVNVIPEVTKVTFDLSKDETTTATEEEMSWVTTEVTMIAKKSSAGTNTNNYYPGTSGQNYTSTRFYKNSTLTITPAAGITITSIEYTATTSAYASALSGSKWDNATTAASGTLVTITPNDGTKTITATIGGTTGASSIVIYYTGDATAALNSIAISGTYPTEFNKGDVFSHEGMTVTANYTDGNTKDVTADATFSGYDMNTLGEQTVSVSYTEGEITKTAEYTITISKVSSELTPAADGYETVDFTSIEPYKSLGNNGTADMTIYEGTSFSAEFAKKAGTNNAPKFYQNGNAVRCYVDNTITITGAEEIKYVDIAWAGTYVDDAVSITGLGTTTAVVTFSKTCRFTAIMVEYSYPSLTISDAGYATYYNKSAYKMPEGVTGKILVKENGTITSKNAYKAGDIVPEETALLLKGEGTYDLILTAKKGDASMREGNLLHGLLEKGTTTGAKDGEKYYILGKKNDVLGWYWGAADGAAFTLGANKCYLVVEPSTSSVKNFFAIEGDEEDAIMSVENKTNNTIYDLQGRRVNGSQKGLYIVNGKKYMVK